MKFPVRVAKDAMVDDTAAAAAAAATARSVNSIVSHGVSFATINDWKSSICCRFENTTPRVLVML